MFINCNVPSRLLGSLLLLSCPITAGLACAFGQPSCPFFSPLGLHQIFFLRDRSTLMVPLITNGLALNSCPQSCPLGKRRPSTSKRNSSASRWRRASGTDFPHRIFSSCLKIAWSGCPQESTWIHALSPSRSLTGSWPSHGRPHQQRTWGTGRQDWTKRGRWRVSF